MKEVADTPSSYPPRGGTCVYFVKAAPGGRHAPSNASTPLFELSTLGIRDTGRDAPRVQAALRSLITSPGRPPAFRRAHGNATLWYNVHVSAASIPDAQSPMARDNILGHPSLPDSAQRTRRRRGARALYQIPARLCASARGGGRAASLPT